MAMDDKLIICGRGHRGKRLAYAILRHLERDGVAHVAALSEAGVEHIVRVGQTVANSIGEPVHADPERREIEVTPGVRRLALVMTWRIGPAPDDGPTETVDVETTPDGVTEMAALPDVITGTPE